MSVLVFIQCDERNPFEMDFSNAPPPFEIGGLEKVEIAEGLFFYDVAVGSGVECTERDIVLIHYTARSRRSDRVVSSTYANDRVDPAQITLGRAINNIAIYTGFSVNDFPGLRRGMAGMLEGGKRTLIVPPSMGIGLTDTLQVDVELFSIFF